jgi:hypothetical protein
MVEVKKSENVSFGGMKSSETETIEIKELDWTTQHFH